MLTGKLRALLRSRRGAVAAIVAVTLPALLVGTGLAVETAFVELRQSQLQAVADASAGAARQVYDSYTAGQQNLPVGEAQRIATANNMQSAVAAGDVVQGWWDITITSTDPNIDKFGPPIAGQTGLPFSNAIRITAREDHAIAMGALLGKSRLALAVTSTGYKCSNLDYPLTLIPDDPTPPTKPAIYFSWATPDHPDPKTSYYYQQPNGQKNPIFKFYSPIDGEDVSFVVHNADGSDLLQVDTYCKGTYLVAPAAFDWTNMANFTASVFRGNTNNSFSLYPDQSQYTFESKTTNFYGTNFVQLKDLHPDKVHTTPYPSANGIQYWASEGNPTPDRRSVLVR